MPAACGVHEHVISGQLATSLAMLPVPLCVSVLVRACPPFQQLCQHQTFETGCWSPWLTAPVCHLSRPLANLFLPWPPPFGITVSVWKLLFDSTEPAYRSGPLPEDCNVMSEECRITLSVFSFLYVCAQGYVRVSLCKCECKMEPVGVG